MSGDLRSIWEQWKSFVGHKNPAPNAAEQNSSETVITGVGDTNIIGAAYALQDDNTVISINSDNTGWYTIAGSAYTVVDSVEMTKIKKIEADVAAIKDRLAILDEPSPEKLEQYKMLKEAYTKYKMIEKLIGEKNVGRDGPST